MRPLRSGEEKKKKIEEEEDRNHTTSRFTTPSCRRPWSPRGRTDVEAESTTSRRPRGRPQAAADELTELLALLCYVPCCCVCAVFNLLLFAAVLSFQLACHPLRPALFL